MSFSWLNLHTQAGLLPPAQPEPLATPRPHQQRALVSIFKEHHKGTREMLCVMATGSGKTILGALVAARFRNMLFLVHQEELFLQTVRTLQKLFPTETIGTIFENKLELDSRMVVGMVKTVHNRLPKIPRGHFDLVIADEAHLSMSVTWATVLDHFRPKLLLGLSATPERLDGASLKSRFKRIVFEYSIQDAIQECALVPIRAYRVKTHLTLSGLDHQDGDFALKQLARQVNIPQRNQQVVDAYLKHARGQKAIAYCADIQHAKDLAEAFRCRGIPAAAIWGNDPDRKAKLQQSRSGKLKLLTNCDLLTTGYDDPGLECVLMCRPTESRVLYVQAIGRVLRLCPGKKEGTVIDFTDNHQRHRLVGAWNFLGNPQLLKDTADLQRKHTLDRSIRDAHDDYLAFGGLLSITEFFESIKLLDEPPIPREWNLGGYAWHSEGATEKQLELLQREGYDTQNTHWSKGQAQMVIENLPPNENQTRLLLAFGFDVFTRHWTRGQADKALHHVRDKGQKPDWKRVNLFFGSQKMTT